MYMDIITSIITFGLAYVFAAVIWGIRLEGRVNVQEQRHADLRELISTRFDTVESRLERIEKALNGMLKE